MGWVTFLIAKPIKEAFPPIDPSSHSPWAGQTAETIEMFGLTVAVSAMIIVGIRSVRRDGFKLKKIWVLALGFVTCTVMILQCLMLHRIFEQSDVTEQDKNILKQLESKLANQDMTLDKRAIWSKIYAGMKYDYDGIRITYIAPDGTQVLFEPTSKNIENRNVRVKLVEITKWGKRYPYNAAISWGIIGVISAIFGIFTPVKQSATETTEQPAPRDRFAPRDP